MNIFNRLFSRSGGFAIPYLISLYDDENHLVLNFANYDKDILYIGRRFVSASFKYTPSMSEYGFDGGGSLEISTQEEQIIDLIDRYNKIHMEVIGVVNEGEEITELKRFAHQYGTISANRNSITFNFNKDDRLEMTFPTLIWSTQNNSGNA